MPNAADSRTITEALLAARRLTEKLTLGQSPSRSDIQHTDALLKSALLAEDAALTT